MPNELSHFDKDGASQMVDVSQKTVTDRVARASGRISMAAETLRLIRDRRLAKGDVLEVARLAGIMAAKRTADLIPLAHPIALTHVGVAVDIDAAAGIVRIEAEARTTGQTGVEMEALTAVSVAALTVYDMVKAADKAMIISDIRVVLKDGGKSGRYEGR